MRGRFRGKVSSRASPMHKWSMDALCSIIIRMLFSKFDCFIVIEGRRGLGKCQIKGDEVLMSNGEWKNIEDIKKGDEVISPQKDGSFKFSKVIEIHNRFEKDVYEVRENTRKKQLLYTCAGNHDIPLIPNTKNKFKLLTAEELNKYYTKQSHYSSFTTSAINFKNKKDCEIEPYSLGVFLGDGSFSSIRKQRTDGKYKGNWLGRDLNITTQDFEIIEKISQYYPIMKIYSKKGTKAKMYRFSLNGDFSKQLSKLGLEGKRSGEKFIPKECLLSSINYRLKLLAGLIDTDGYVMKNKDNHIEITSKSKRLAEDIKNLVLSLGGYSSIKKIKKKCQNNFEGTYYDIKISFENPKIIPLLTWKKQRLGKRMKHNPRHIAINCIKTKPQIVYGFEIDSPSKLYITNNYMVTHNSTLGFHILNRVSQMIKQIEEVENKQYAFKPKKDILYTQDEVLSAINKRWHDSFMCDEMINVTFNRDFYSESQKKIIKALNMNRDHSNLILSCVPQFSNLDNQIKNLCKIKITVVKRGLAIIHTPQKSTYLKDIWDGATNEKIERQWLMKGINNPKYSRLTTFRGVLKFRDLSKKNREVYEKIKVDKRNQIIADSEEKKDEGKGSVAKNMLGLMEKGRITDRKQFDELCLLGGHNPLLIQNQINKYFRGIGDKRRFQEMLPLDNKKGGKKKMVTQDLPLILTE